MNTIIFTLTIICLPIIGFAQQIFFAVKFKDKQHNTYKLSQPEDFLSEKAIERRTTQHKPFLEEDLPPSPIYVQKLKELNLDLLYTSRWLNTAVVSTTETMAAYLRLLPFVATVDYIGKLPDYEMIIEESVKRKETKRGNEYYGKAKKQIEIVNGHLLHDSGFSGQDQTIAVLDAGFWGTDKIPSLSYFNQQSRKDWHKNFVDDNQNIFDTSDHGTKVLSIMAANLPGIMVGTAPNANYLCLKTEDIRAEYLLDEYNWVAGLEYADSIGADIIVSGVGYTVFDDSTMNYSLPNLYQNSALSTNAANIAFNKGMIIVVSAGNEGDNDWQYVSCPADGIHVLSVGAIDEYGNVPDFNSKNTLIDGKEKPDLFALGEQVAAATAVGRKHVEYVKGTSFTAPIIGGLIASLWSAFPEEDNLSILKAVIASKYHNPIFAGLPDFGLAFQLLRQKNITAVEEEKERKNNWTGDNFNKRK